jgi:integrase
MKTRHQRGYLYRKSECWYVRYYDTAPDGKRVQKAHKLARCTGEYRTKTAARGLADEFLAPLNSVDQPSAVTLKEFVESTYFPSIEREKRASTLHGYQSLWNGYLAENVRNVQIRHFRTSDGERILGEIAQQCDLNVTTLRHIKAFLSGVFRYAKRQGILVTENPIRDVMVPRARPAGETYAYSFAEVGRMLELLPEPAATIVAAAAFTGARRGELRGFSWEDYDGKEIRISRAYWRDTVAEPKTVRSKAPVPVIPQLAERLNRLRKAAGDQVGGLMFPAAHNKDVISPLPIDLDALARDVIIPTLKDTGLAWHGWHAFRRGLATNLHQLGVQDKVIQRILRHSNVAVTQACYIKTADADVQRAMEQLAVASGERQTGPRSDSRVGT